MIEFCPWYWGVFLVLPLQSCTLGRLYDVDGKGEKGEGREAFTLDAMMQASCRNFYFLIINLLSIIELVPATPNNELFLKG